VIFACGVIAFIVGWVFYEADTDAWGRSGSLGALGGLLKFGGFVAVVASVCILAWEHLP
jgi:hypothetical protein